ncbi:hypothetical protein CVT26_007606 [Gymnopilus dilepis]|uniref:WIBG Mago-binding domain-containing protein n=1 Tax=Gymnopilus dilepis TaxID=231916 RepID=A0A409VZS9_9AGAR|nr:hypothetical protein CVT26_007606 [Gymnopilus dilepis]
MSRPPVNPEKTAAGIIVDPHTLERVIPESRRPDGTVRKQIKIRPGFTPQEDVRRFRGTKQAQMDANALPKGHIIGWAPPPTGTASSGANGAKPMTKSAKKNAKRKEKREKEKAEAADVPDDWDDDEDLAKPSTAPAATAKADSPSTKDAVKSTENANNTPEELAAKLQKLDVK